MFTPKVAYALYVFLPADIQSIIYSFLEYSVPAPEPNDINKLGLALLVVRQSFTRNYSDRNK
jgi:hypothetical protein